MELRKSKAKLVEYGIQQKVIAEKAEVSEAAVSKWCNNKIRSKHIARVVRQELGKYRTKQAPR